RCVVQYPSPVSRGAAAVEAAPAAGESAAAESASTATETAAASHAAHDVAENDAGRDIAQAAAAATPVVRREPAAARAEDRTQHEEADQERQDTEQRKPAAGVDLHLTQRELLLCRGREAFLVQQRGDGADAGHQA